MSELKYRPNVAFIVTDGQGNVLMCERSDAKYAGAMQTVQGGIDEGESARDAAARELQEELGLHPEDFEIIAEMDGVFRYEWDEEHRRNFPSEYVGQEQKYFLARVHPNVHFELDAHFREFTRVLWGKPEEFVARCWEGKRPGIVAALEVFGLLTVAEQSA